MNGLEDSPKILKEILKERIKVSATNSFKNNLFYTLISILLFILFLFYFKNPYSLVIYILAFLMLYPFLLDLFFYASYYETWESLTRLLSIGKNEKENDSNLEKFQINYNNLRKNLKRRISSSRGNLLTYDYQVGRIVRDIDTFFDSTIKILFRRKVMKIPFSPIDEYDLYIEDIKEQSHLDESKWMPPPNNPEHESWEFKNVDLNTINIFLKYFGDTVIRKPKTRGINTIAVGELFRKWNSIVKDKNADLYEESKCDVDKYYDEKREKRGFFLKTIYDLLVLLISGVFVQVVIYFVTK